MKLRASASVYQCPALSARILARQCDANRKTARGESIERPLHGGQAFHASTGSPLTPCKTCPGVRALASRGVTDPPTSVESVIAERTRATSRRSAGWVLSGVGISRWSIR